MEKYKLYTHDEAKALLKDIEDFFSGKIGVPKVKGNFIGYFRADSYDWTAFKLKYKKDKLTLIKREHIQHEGYCRIFLKLKQLT